MHILASIPTAYAGVFILHASGDSETVEQRRRSFGATLMLAAGAKVFRSWLQARRSAAGEPGNVRRSRRERSPFGFRSLLIGAFGGLMVGLTSVGSIIITCLMLTYSQLRGAHLVGARDRLGPDVSNGPTARPHPAKRGNASPFQQIGGKLERLLHRG